MQLPRTTSNSQSLSIQNDACRAGVTLVSHKQSRYSNNWPNMLNRKGHKLLFIPSLVALRALLIHFLCLTLHVLLGRTYLDTAVDTLFAWCDIQCRVTVKKVARFK